MPKQQISDPFDVYDAFPFPWAVGETASYGYPRIEDANGQSVVSSFARIVHTHGLQAAKWLAEEIVQIINTLANMTCETCRTWNRDLFHREDGKLSAWGVCHLTYCAERNPNLDEWKVSTKAFSLAFNDAGSVLITHKCFYCNQRKNKDKEGKDETTSTD